MNGLFQLIAAGSGIEVPADAGQGYVAAAYLVFVLILILYVSIMAMRLKRMAKDIEVIDEMIQAKDDHAGDQPPRLPAEETGISGA